MSLTPTLWLAGFPLPAAVAFPESLTSYIFALRKAIGINIVAATGHLPCLGLLDPPKFLGEKVVPPKPSSLEKNEM